MKIRIILNEPYPIGMACTNRIHLYAKGFAELKHDVKIIIPRPTERIGHINNNQQKGIFEGVSFEYASTSTIRSKHFFKRRVNDYYALIKTCFICLKEKPDIILVIGENIVQLMLLKLCVILINGSIIREKSEVPFSNKNRLYFMDKLKIKISYNLLDGILVISERLLNFYKSDFGIKAKILQVPILINPKIIKEEKTTKLSNNLVYTGSLSQYKDGVITIIKSFIQIASKYSELKLVMTGNLNCSSDRNNILKIVENCECKDRIVFTGFISSKELDKLTHNAKILVLAKPMNRQNKYNAATKIGEYLLTGRPVLMTNVDNALQGFRNKENIYLCEPDDIQSFTNALIFIMEHYKQAEIVAIKGKELALNSFNYQIHTKRIVDFYHEF